MFLDISLSFPDRIKTFSIQDLLNYFFRSSKLEGEYVCEKKSCPNRINHNYSASI